MAEKREAGFAEKRAWSGCWDVLVGPEALNLWTKETLVRLKYFESASKGS